MVDVAVIGATGLVGREMLAILAERGLPIGRLRALATARSAGSKVRWRDRTLVVEDVETVHDVDFEFGLASAGAEAARALLPRLAESGAVVIDNSSAFRQDLAVPLVVPEVNAHTLAGHPHIVANPNCSTIQLVVALKPLLDAVGLRRVTVATYQSVSGAGQKGLDELDAGLSSRSSARSEVFAHPIAFEALPHCGTLDSDGWTTEERKLMMETRRILERPDLPVSATAVRVPVRRSHSEAVWVETAEPIDAAQARTLWRAAPGIEVIDQPLSAQYPRALQAAGTDPVYVGRVRRDPADARALAFWVVADNVRKGAALNAIQILEQLIGAKPTGLASRSAHDRG